MNEKNGFIVKNDLRILKSKKVDCHMIQMDGRLWIAECEWAKNQIK
jgi:hypothetical protein